MDKQAIKPTFLSINDFVKEKVEKTIEDLTDEEKVLAAGAKQSFWIELKKHINNQIVELDKINEIAIQTGMPLEEIGRNTIVISQVKGVINRIFNIVEDSREAVEQSGK